MGASLDFAEILGLSQQPVRFVALSDDSAAFLFACSAFYQSRYNWRVDGEKPTDAEWNDIQRLIGKAEFELMNTLVGLIYPHALGSLAGLPFLPCDGAVYNRVDYPILYEKLDAIYRVDADTFRVPDMRDRFLVGEGVDRSLDDSGGEAEVTLTVGQLPSHSHGNVPHEHFYTSAVTTIINGGLEAPASAAVPFVDQTSAVSIEIDETGGDNPHNNMPPFVTVRWAIVAG